MPNGLASCPNSWLDETVAVHGQMEAYIVVLPCTLTQMTCNLMIIYIIHTI